MVVSVLARNYTCAGQEEKTNRDGHDEAEGFLKLGGDAVVLGRATLKGVGCLMIVGALQLEIEIESWKGCARGGVGQETGCGSVSVSVSESGWMSSVSYEAEAWEIGFLIQTLILTNMMRCDVFRFVPEICFLKTSVP